MNTIQKYFTTQHPVDEACSRVVRILRTITKLTDWVGEKSIVKSIGFDAIGEMNPPFVVVSAVSEEDDFKPGSVSTLLPVGILIGYEVTDSVEDLDAASIVSVIQEIKKKLYEKPHHTLKVVNSDDVLSLGIARFQTVDYQSQRLDSGSIEAAVLLRVDYRLALQVTTREPW